MNYEELVSSYTTNGNMRQVTPIGVMQKRRVDTKYETVLTLHDWLVSDPIFMSQIKRESADTAEIKNDYQIPFTLNDNATELIIGQGNYMSLEQFLNENPAMCADAKYFGGPVILKRKQHAVFSGGGPGLPKTASWAEACAFYADAYGRLGKHYRDNLPGVGTRRDCRPCFL